MADSAGRLLVVEDDAQTREIVCRALAEYQVIEADSAEGAIEVMASDIKRCVGVVRSFNLFIYEPLK